MIKWPNFNTDQHLICQEPDPAHKDLDYYKTNIYAFYSEWVKGVSTIGYGGMDRIDLLRAYAEGKQPDPPQVVSSSTRPSAILDVNGNPVQVNEDAEVPGYNVHHEVWEIFSSANKIMDSLEGALSKIDFEISCDPLDYNTKHEIEDNKLRAWVYSKNQKKIQFAAQLAGVEVPEPGFIPEQPQDLDQNEEMFLPDHAMYVEQVVKHGFDLSHWKPDTIKLLYRDWFACGTACVQDQYDPETGKVLPVYIDIRHADIQPSKFPDHRDSERGWHFELMNLTKIRQYFPNKKEDWFKKVAGSYCGYFGNPSSITNYEKQDAYGNFLYNSFKVCVMSAEWLDIDMTKEVIGEKHGRKQVKQVPLDKKVAQDKTVRFSEDRRRYEAKWIVGTEEIFEYGPAHENSPYLTYHWYTLPGKSKIEVLVPVLKQLQDLWDRYREVLRNAKGKGEVIDIDKLASTGGTDNPQESAKKAYRRFLSTYTMFIRRVNAAGMPDLSAPLSETSGGMGDLFQELMLAFKMNFDLQEQLSGLNPLSLGQAPDPNAPVTTSQMAMNATTSSLKPLVDGYARTKQGVAENEARWVVMLIRGNEFSRSAYEEVVGQYGIQALIAASRADAAYGFRLVARPTDLEKQWLLQNLQAAVTPAQGGEREISTADANVILNMIASETPMKTVQFAFEKARRKQEAALMAKKKELMQQQSQLNQQDAQVSAKAKMDADTQAHGFKMAQIQESNKGLIGNSVTQEEIRKSKDVEVAHIKSRSEMKHLMRDPKTGKLVEMSRKQIKEKLQAKNPGVEITDEDVDKTVMQHA